ncbi:MAG TPA: cytochrome c oxidase assembly factor Coa1 family protein [Thermoanaerobaculia bacterium]
MTAVAVEPGPKKSSWLKWVALGCAAIVLLGVIAAGALLFFVFGAVKKSAPFTEALARARANPAVVAAIGEPIETGFLVSGNVGYEGSGGTASLAIPLKGPKGSGKLYVEATRAAGAWQYQRLEFEPEGGGARIDLLAETAQTPPATPAGAAEPPTTTTAASSAVPILDALVFAMDTPEAEVRELIERFPAGVTAVLGGVHFAGVRAEDEIVQRWYRDGEKIDEQALEAAELWDGALPPEGWFTLRLGSDEPLASGNYRLDVWLNGTRAQSGTFVIE